MKHSVDLLICLATIDCQPDRHIVVGAALTLPGLKDELCKTDLLGLRFDCANDSVRRDYLIRILGRQITVWQDLNCPETHEEWMQAQETRVYHERMGDYEQKYGDQWGRFPGEERE